MSESTPNMLDYEETYRDFKMEVPEHFNFGFDVVDKWAEDRTKLALISLDPSGEHSRQHTFWDLKVQSNRFANVLKDLGVTKGARVFLMLPRIPEWYVAMLGLIKLGAVPMPATTLCTSSDIVYRVNEADAYLAITDSENSDKLAEAAGSCPSLQRLMVVGDERRPVAHILHLRHRGLSQDGAAHPGLLRDRPHIDRQVLARSPAHRLAVDLVGHRLGQGGLRQAVRSMDPGRGGVAA